MSFLALILRGLTHHWPAHLGSALGSAVATLALTGALLVGSSMRGSLQELALERLGTTTIALNSPEHPMDAGEKALLIEKSTGVPTAGVLRLTATASRPDAQSNSGEGARAFNVQVLAVDPAFEKLSSAQPSGEFAKLQKGEVLLNERLAEQLEAKAGDTVILRVDKPSLLPRDAPLAPEEGNSFALRLTVKAILSSAQGGNFNLQASQIPPANAFVAASTVKAQAGSKINLILQGENAKPEGANSSFNQTASLADLGVETRKLGTTGEIELRTGRIFFETPLADTIKAQHPDARGILTYLVNEIRCNGKGTPYSMASALDAAYYKDNKIELALDEVLVTPWLAEDLGCKAGDEIEVVYFVLGENRRLEETSTKFRVKGITPDVNIFLDRELMPAFPGLENSKSCRTWDPGFPLKLSKIRDKDEAYWNKYKGTPKLFIHPDKAKTIWGNRFGNFTAFRLPGNTDAKKAAEAIWAKVKPADFGLSFMDVRAQAMNAATQGVDFGGLFIGFSFFVIGAALLLMALLFLFGVEQRGEEAGTLLALGFTPAKVRSLFWREGAFAALFGSILGSLGGEWYARMMLRGLSTIWKDAVGTSALHFYSDPAMQWGGCAGGFICAALTVRWAVRSQAKLSVRELLNGTRDEEFAQLGTVKKSKGRWFALGAGIPAIILTLIALKANRPQPEIFFGAGFLGLVGTLGLCAWLLQRSARNPIDARMNIKVLCWKNLTRRRGRSLAAIALLACGGFLAGAVGAQRKDATPPEDRTAQLKSGTGGFAFYAESALPLVHDLTDPEERARMALDEKIFKNAEIVPFKLREGDDASCLNLNRAQAPRVLGVKPALLKTHFGFSGVLKEAGTPEDGWNALNFKDKDGRVPLIGDENTVLWGLGKGLGDTIELKDEQGKPFTGLIVGTLGDSMLQGVLITSEDTFKKLYPATSGYRIFLADAPSESREALGTALKRGLRDFGLELTTATKRMDTFNAIQNTYVSAFAALGGLGLVLGSVGLGVLVLRNVIDRRAELAVMRALGFRKLSLFQLLLAEHVGILAIGLFCGAAAALLAAYPVLNTVRPESLVIASLFLSGALWNGLIWTTLATAWALRGPLMDGLRGE